MKHFILKIINFLLKIFKIKLIKISNQFNNSYRLVLALKKNKIDHILDIGANEGQFVREIRYYGYKYKVTSFEPLIGAHEKLLKTSKKDKNWNVFRPIAIGSKNSKTFINVSEKNSVSSSILQISKEHINNAPKSKFINKQSIEERKLEDILNEINIGEQNLFLKIDAQGYEFQILQGCINILEKFKGVLIEVSLVELYIGQKNWLEIVDLIQSHGFKLWSVDRGFTNKRNGKTLQLDLCFFRE